MLGVGSGRGVVLGGMSGMSRGRAALLAGHKLAQSTGCSAVLMSPQDRERVACASLRVPCLCPGVSLGEWKFAVCLARRLLPRWGLGKRLWGKRGDGDAGGAGFSCQGLPRAAAQSTGASDPHSSRANKSSVAAIWEDKNLSSGVNHCPRYRSFAPVGGLSA